MVRRAWDILGILIALVAVSLPVSAQVIHDELPAQIKGLELHDSRGDQIPGDIVLYNAEGEPVPMSSYFQGDKPIVLVPVYYSCPKLCGLMLQHLNEIVNDLDYDIGEDYTVLVYSFDHTNTTAMAKGKQTQHQKAYKRGISKLGRQSYLFHTTSAADAKRLGDAIGFDFRYLPKTREFSHPSALYVLTPDGHVSSYLSGLDYGPKQLKLALLDASDGKIAASVGDFFLHMCFQLDPNAGQYSVQAMRVMQIGGIISMFGVGLLVGGLRLAEGIRRRKRQRMETGSIPGSGLPVAVGVGDEAHLKGGVRP